MKKSKRIISTVALAALFGGVALTTVACSSEPAKTSTVELAPAIKQARSYLKGLYDARNTETGSAYELLTEVPVGTETVKVTWTVTVKEGGKAEDVKVEAVEGKTEVKVVVNEFATQATQYTLKGELKDAAGNQGTLEYNYTVPKFASTSHDKWLANAKAGKGTNTIQGYILGWYDSNFYMVGEDGFGYYVYGPQLGDLKKDNLPEGSSVIVKGEGTVYNGQYEFTNKPAVSAGLLEKKDHAAILATAKDATNDWAKAAKNTDDSLIPYQNGLVTLKNCKATRVDGSYYYFTIGDSTTEYNLYFNTKFQTAAEVNKVTDQWIAGATFNLTGLVSVYSKVYQIYPILKANETLTNYNLPNKTDAEKVAYVKETLKLSATTFKKAGTLTLPATGYAGQVAITWASANTDLVAIANGKATIKLAADAETKVKLTATFTAGTETATKEYELTVGKEPNPQIPSTAATVVLVSNEVQIDGKTIENKQVVDKAITSGDVKLTFAKAKGSTVPTYYTSDKGDAIRLYASTTLTIEGLNGKKVVAVRFTVSTDTEGDLDADKGEYKENKWSGNEAKVVFTESVSGKQYRIVKVEIWLA